MGITKYILAENVVVFNNGVDEIRVRRGIWNYEEAIISVEGLTDTMKEIINEMVRTLDIGEELDAEKVLSDKRLLQHEKDSIEGLVLGLKEQGYIRDSEESKTTQLLYEILNGSIQARFLQNDIYLKPILFFSDSEDVKNYAVALCNKMSLPIHVVSEEEYREIIKMDLTSRFDGYETSKAVKKLVKFIEPYSCLVGGLQKVNVSFMRNLNRALIEANKPLSMALIDGPFTTVFTIKPPETGCFECMEQRLTARIEDMQVYRRFVEHTRGMNVSAVNSYAAPIMNSIVSTAIFEGLIISAVGKSKLAGRALNTYIPVMEIQVEDILRVPFCPACGTIAKAKIEEMYTSTRKMVDKIIDNIELGN
ncbi:hypothetical protein [Clostridium polynesiense]|uniref:hypothetical protein n=1 Tax=Clostridium polynesiense TaxID=1325933 RepID=UPI00058DB0CD|nr:hypothetical protein [Clostridium polynesiense]